MVVIEEMVERILIGGQKKITNWTLPNVYTLMARSKTKCLIRINSDKIS